MTHAQWLILCIFCLSYLGLAVGRVPKLPIGRAEIVFVGAAAMLLFSDFHLSEAATVINFPVLCLLFGMMVILAYLELSGFFELIVNYINRVCHQPKILLAVTIIVAGVLSAFLINDVVCLAMAPMLIQICRQRQLPIVPYLIALATAANIGSVATLTGNPQNMLIGHFAELHYGSFIMHMAPIAVIGLILDYVLLLLIHGKQLTVKVQAVISPPNVVKPKGLLIKSVLVLVMVVILFFTQIPLGASALFGAALLFIGRTDHKKVYQLIDGSLLVFFISLFVLVGALQSKVLIHATFFQLPLLQHKAIISIAAVILSNIVSNVPAALLFKPLVLQSVHLQQQGMLLAAMTTLAGNLTILGSIANLIVAQQAKRQGIHLGFMEFLKVGLPVTLATCVLAYFIL